MSGFDIRWEDYPKKNQKDKFGYEISSDTQGYVGVGPTALSAAKQALKQIEGEPAELLLTVRYWHESDDFEAVLITIGE